MLVALTKTEKICTAMTQASGKTDTNLILGLVTIMEGQKILLYSSSMKFLTSINLFQRKYADEHMTL
jgi:hypothetical protein